MKLLPLPKNLTSLSKLAPAMTGMARKKVLSLIPGTSRSGSTILGGMLCGMSRPAASQFTFFLAIPVMALSLIHISESSHSATLNSRIPVDSVVP